jgi:hypothetical protein
VGRDFPRSYPYWTLLTKITLEKGKNMGKYGEKPEKGNVA